MESERIDERLLVKYLLGNLPDEEQARVEDRAFSDPAYLAALDAAEADLIDAYVQGHMPQADRLSFEHRFLTSARRRDKVDFATALARVAAESKDLKQTSAETRSVWGALTDLVRGWNRSFQFGAGLAAAVFLVTVFWAIAEHQATRTRIVALEAQQRDLAVRAQQLQRQLGAEQELAGRLAADLHKQQSGAGTASAVASLMLLGGVSRAQARGEQLMLEASTRLVRIEMQLEARDDYSRFRAELRTRRGDEILIRSNLHRRRDGAGYLVGFETPAEALGAGEYELALKGVRSDGTVEDVAYYYFSVRQR
jgi:hypothetical protein